MESFCREIRAGYSVKGARSEGSRLLKLPHIQERIAVLRAELAARSSVDPEKIVRELALIGFADIGDVLRMSGDKLTFDFQNMPPEFTKSIASIKVDTYTEGRGNRGEEVRSVDIKMIDKRGALVDLAKVFGMMREQVDHSITRSHESDEFNDVDDATLMEFINSKGSTSAQAQRTIAVEATVVAVNRVEPTVDLSSTDEQQGDDVSNGTDPERTARTEGATAVRVVGESEATPLPDTAGATVDDMNS